MSKVKSPCKNLCRYKNGQCSDCLRTISEIAGWESMSDKEKKEVLKLIEQRRKDQGMDYYGSPVG